jgi:hypothetical protein
VRNAADADALRLGISIILRKETEKRKEKKKKKEIKLEKLNEKALRMEFIFLHCFKFKSLLIYSAL